MDVSLSPSRRSVLAAPAAAYGIGALPVQLRAEVEDGAIRQ
ncbi:hypothetical protein [Rhodopila globiformis]|nr:hypothetical protein [Rhodopila globiformis]